ncbi:TPA: hypothetical protein DF272_00065 [Candidatus Falkowbacteria bacterium]|nr:hypothetical protein [Candidatus Falkowbacteria bacterium]
MSIIAICSDSHDNIPNINKFLNQCALKTVDLVIHCGDITTKETRQYFQDNFKGKISFVKGNADIESEDDDNQRWRRGKKTNRFLVIKRQPIPFIEGVIDGIRFAACHEKEKAKRLAEKNLYHFVFYGHSHKPWQEKINQTYLINPGTLAGMFTPPTFAIYDTKTRILDLIQLNQI